MPKINPDLCESFDLGDRTYVIPIVVVVEIERLRSALQKIVDIETQLGVPAGIDMKSIAKAALAASISVKS